MLLYGLAIFASAFLLFQVQPLITKIILPWFGGVAAVWTVCLLFFQVVLLAGYFYAPRAGHKIVSSYAGPNSCRCGYSKFIGAANLAETFACTRRFRSPRLAHSHDLGCIGGIAIFCFVRFEPAPAILVFPCEARCRPLSLLRSLEYRIDAGAA